MKLLVVESPGKVKKIKSFLGSGWQVRASVGHVRDLPAKSLGIRFEQGKVELDYEVVSGKKKTVSELRRAADQASEIYLAMDMDREGEAIAWHVGMLLGKNNWPKIQRITFTEITKKAVQASLKHARRVNAHLVNAQQARRAVDRLVGFMVSPMLWKRKGVGTSAGRVQSVAVRLVVEREWEIRNFKPEEYWKIKAELQGSPEEASFWSELVGLEGKSVVSKIEPTKEKTQTVICNEETALRWVAVFEQGTWIVKNQEQKTRQKRPYPPFITSTLQQAASGRLKWGAKQTMQVAQKLYEKGLITYMRTDSPVIAEEAIAMARSWIGTNFPAEYLPKSAFRYQAKVSNAQEAHECIRPTQVQQHPEHLVEVSRDERLLYELIWKQFLACQMSPAQYQMASIDIQNGPGLFRATGRRVVFDGWMRLTGGDPEEKKQEDVPALLPPVTVGQELCKKDMKASQHFTQPPHRYNEARLIRTLEKMGIGRPSTYAAILENIRKRGYLTEEKRQFHASPVGEALVSFLCETFRDSFMDYQFTASMEEGLDKVSRGELTWHQLVTGFKGELEKKVGPLPVNRVAPVQTNEACPKCQSPLLKREGRYGAFLACSGFPKCRHTTPLPTPAQALS